MKDPRTDAMEVVLTWGPERMIPEPERLKRLQPGLDPNAIEAALAEAWKVMAEAESMAADIKSGQESSASSKLQADRPWLTDEHAARAIQQGLYAHWRDTGM